MAGSVIHLSVCLSVCLSVRNCVPLAIGQIWFILGLMIISIEVQHHFAFVIIALTFLCSLIETADP